MMREEKLEWHLNRLEERLHQQTEELKALRLHLNQPAQEQKQEDLNEPVWPPRWWGIVNDHTHRIVRLEHDLSELEKKVTDLQGVMKLLVKAMPQIETAIAKMGYHLD